MKFKDPITGEYKELFLKASDTLPIGAIVDYDGDEVPVGYEKVTGANDYTEEEHVIGTWFGKPLYRKVVPVNFSTSSTSAETPHGISNIDYICKQKLNWFDTVDKVWYEQNKDVGTDDYFIKIDFVTPTNIVIKKNAYNWQSRTRDRYCILEYTKTTDSEVSD